MRARARPPGSASALCWLTSGRLQRSWRAPSPRPGRGPSAPWTELSTGTLAPGQAPLRPRSRHSLRRLSTLESFTAGAEYRSPFRDRNIVQVGSHWLRPVARSAQGRVRRASLCKSWSIDTSLLQQHTLQKASSVSKSALAPLMCQSGCRASLHLTKMQIAAAHWEAGHPGYPHLGSLYQQLRLHDGKRSDTGAVGDVIFLSNAPGHLYWPVKMSGIYTCCERPSMPVMLVF